MAIDLNAYITPHFRWEEFVRADGLVPSSVFFEGHFVSGTDILNNIQDLARHLETLRIAKFNGSAIDINSGFRTVAHNKKIGGAPNSQHLVGKAADIMARGVTPAQVQELLKDWDGGLGSYDTWTHIDTGPKRRWRG
jgi:zinc D-Ala-D-Ala carboxypeptidase